MITCPYKQYIYISIRPEKYCRWQYSFSWKQFSSFYLRKILFIIIITLKHSIENEFHFFKFSVSKRAYKQQTWFELQVSFSDFIALSIVMLKTIYVLVLKRIREEFIKSEMWTFKNGRFCVQHSSFFFWEFFSLRLRLSLLRTIFHSLCYTTAKMVFILTGSKRKKNFSSITRLDNVSCFLFI